MVRSDDRRVHKDQAQLGPACRLGTLKEAFPDAELGPAQEGLGRHPPRAEFSRDGAPFGTVLHAPEDGFDSPAQVGELAPCLGSHGLDQRLNRTPLGIGEHRHGLAPSYLDGEVPRCSTTRKSAQKLAAAEP